MFSYARLFVSIIITSIFVILFAVIIPIYVEKPFFIPGFAPGPTVWPNTISITGIMFGLILLVSNILQLRNGKNNQSEGQDTSDHSLSSKVIVWRVCSSIFILMSYVFLIPVLGIIFSSIILLATLFLYIGIEENIRWMISLTIIFPVAIYLLFANVTHTIFPMGSIWEKLGLF